MKAGTAHSPCPTTPRVPPLPVSHHSPCPTTPLSHHSPVPPLPCPTTPRVPPLSVSHQLPCPTTSLSHHSPCPTTPRVPPLPVSHHSPCPTTPPVPPLPVSHHSPCPTTLRIPPLPMSHHSPCPTTPPVPPLPPTRGWIHGDDQIMGSGVAYTVRYMGCVEVLKSMRSLDFNTRTLVTREAIGRVCEAVPGSNGSFRRRKGPSQTLGDVLGKSNLQFAGLDIILTISISSLNLMTPETKQIIANHHMQSISFASGGDQETTDYVAYVAKDPVNQRACHVLECLEGLAQDVICTIGQAFEQRFKQYLKSPARPAAVAATATAAATAIPHSRATGRDHEYYNDLPAKEPPPGGLVDARTLEGAGGGGAGAGGAAWAGARPQRPPQSSMVSGCAVYGSGGMRPGARVEATEDPSYVNTSDMDGGDGDLLLNAADALLTSAALSETRFVTRMTSSTSHPPPSSHSAPSTPTPPAPGGLSSERLRGEPWFHGRVSRGDAEKLLSRDGDFLVRESGSTPGQYVLTGMQGGRPKHLLLVDPEGVVRTKDRKFDSVNHLISFHRDNQLPIISAGSELCLKQPVHRKL
ncbi:unnamed protein product [Lampetra planeri]